MANYPVKGSKTQRHIAFRLHGKKYEKKLQASKPEADQIEAEWRMKILESERNPNAKSANRFSEIFREYSNDAILHIKATTWNLVRRYQVATLIEYFGDVDCNKLCITSISDFQRARLKAKWRGKATGPKAINNEIRLFRTICNGSRDAGYPIPAIKWRFLPEPGDDYIKVWTGDELQAIYAATRKVWPELLPMLVFLTNTGCRRGEATVAEWNWVDFDRDMITIPCTSYWQPKSNRPRKIPLSTSLRECLLANKRHQTILFPNKDGKHYAQFPKDLFWEILEVAGVDGHPHMFRHTFASNLLKNQPDLYLLSQLLGHSHERITQLYAHLLPDHLARAKNAVDIGPMIVDRNVDQESKIVVSSIG